MFQLLNIHLAPFYRCVYPNKIMHTCLPLSFPLCFLKYNNHVFLLFLTENASHLRVCTCYITSLLLPDIVAALNNKLFLVFPHKVHTSCCLSPDSDLLPSFLHETFGAVWLCGEVDTKFLPSTRLWES